MGIKESSAIAPAPGRKFSVGYLRQLLRPGAFLRNIATLLSGTVIAQAIIIGVSPILTRLYSPEHFGTFALFLALATVLSMVITGRYELAILMPKEDEMAVNVGAAAFLIGTAGCLLLGILVWVGRESIPALLGNLDLERWMFYLPLMIWFLAASQVFIYWFNRRKNFKRMAGNSILRSSSTAGLQTGMGAIQASSGGLVIGALLANGVAGSFLAFRFFREENSMLKQISVARMKEAIKRFHRFPLFDIPAASLSSLAIQMPIYLISAFFGGAVLGLYALTHRVMALPISLVSKAVLGVFKQRATADFHRTGSCRPIFLKSLGLLSVCGLPPCLILLFFGPGLFAFVFGDEWRPAGEYAQILSVMFFLKFVASPLSFVFFIREKQALNLIWQAGVFVGATVALVIGGVVGDLMLALLLFSLSYSIGYVIYLMISFSLTKVDNDPAELTTVGGSSF